MIWKECYTEYMYLEEEFQRICTGSHNSTEIMLKRVLNTIQSINLLTLNFLQKNKTSNWTKLKAFADVKLFHTEMFWLAFDRVENIVEEEKMPVTSVFSFSHNVF